MSSACVCHTDEWCFYHEMYVPLEDRFNMAIVERDGSRRAAEQYRKENEFLKNELEKAQKEIENLKSSGSIIKFECPQCKEKSTTAEWDIQTSIYCGGSEITKILDSDARGAEFVCPSCSEWSDYDSLTKEESK